MQCVCAGKLLVMLFAPLYEYIKARQRACLPECALHILCKLATNNGVRIDAKTVAISLSVSGSGDTQEVMAQ